MFPCTKETSKGKNGKGGSNPRQPEGTTEGAETWPFSTVVHDDNEHHPGSSSPGAGVTLNVFPLALNTLYSLCPLLPSWKPIIDADRVSRTTR
jgi:hypothetical protein